MANNYDSSLLGFLQKKSLFSNTQGTISRKRSRSRSKDSRGGFDQRSNINTLEQRSIDQPIIQNKQPMFNYQPTSPKNQPIIEQKPYVFNIDNSNKPYMDNNAKKTQQNGNGKYQDMFAPFQESAGKSYASNNNRSIGNSSVKNNQVENQQIFSSFNANPTNPNNGAPSNPFNLIQTASNNFNSSTANNFNLTNPNNANGPSMNKPYDGSFRLEPAFQQPTQYKNYQAVSDIRGDRYRQDDRTSVVSKRFDDRPNQNQIWTGLVSHSNSFESARLESVQCLDNLSGKIGQEISNINYKIQAFNSRMAKALNSEFKNIRDRITQIFEAAFRESEKFIKQYMRYKEQEMAGELMKIREMLIRENAKIQTMKEQLKRPQWRKVAGQILSSELQKKVQDVLIKSRESGVGHWELGDIAGQHIKNIDLQLKQIIRIQPGTIK